MEKSEQIIHSSLRTVEWKDGKVIMIDTYSQWTDPSWERMKIITLSSDVSGEVRVKIEVDYDTDMNNDYSDIRFKFQGDNAWLPYWIEEKNPNPSDPYAIFWTLMAARLFSREDGSTSLIGFNFSNSVNNATIELSSEIRKSPGLCSFRGFLFARPPQSELIASSKSRP